jgi:hypothetical protein
MPEKKLENQTERYEDILIYFCDPILIKIHISSKQ